MKRDLSFICIICEFVFSYLNLHLIFNRIEMVTFKVPNVFHTFADILCRLESMLSG